ncbi:retrovirus-related pol polyprotein from transposon TNT 1-94 [Tanacetum coccineum]
MVRGLSKLKYYKDHLCSAYALGKSKKHSHKPKAEDTIQEKLYLLIMDLCGPMRFQSINGRKYILVIVNDYSRFTWVKFLWSKDEVPTFVIKFLKMIQVRLNATVRNIRTDNGTEFVNQTLHFDELTTMASEQFISGPMPQLMTLGIISSGLVPQTPSPTPNVPPIKDEWDLLFQPMFGEYFKSPPSVDHPVPPVGVEEPAVSTESQTHVIPPGVEEEYHDIEVSYVNNNPYFGLPILEPSSKESSVVPTNVHLLNQPQEHIGKWTKDHPLKNIIGDPSRPVLIRLQLHTEALFYYDDAFLSSVEPKSYKDALAESCWIEAMQE